MGILIPSWCGDGLADPQWGFGTGQTGACVGAGEIVGEPHLSITFRPNPHSRGRPGPQPSDKRARCSGGEPSAIKRTVGQEPPACGCLGPLLHHGDKLERQAAIALACTPVVYFFAKRRDQRYHGISWPFLPSRLLNIPRSHTPNCPLIASPFPKTPPTPTPTKEGGLLPPPQRTPTNNRPNQTPHHSRHHDPPPSNDPPPRRHGNRSL